MATIVDSRPETTTDVVLEARNVSRRYGSGETAFNALRGVDVAIRRGESVAIVGKSGSGKSTLMHLLALLDSPSDGSIELDGRSVASLRPAELNRIRNERFGFVFQQFFLIPGQSVLENVTLPLLIAGVNKRERERRGMEMLEAVDLADKARNRATDLSGGQKQRVVIARALINQPAVIFADEPTGNLDTATGASIEELLFSLQREQGITLVIVTHDDELAARCDRAIRIADGVVTATTGAAPKGSTK
ncbi:MAG TPA: ABC transporter ATP-binding protein [Microbacteriaceae bacterium]|nr:ABC transporter ATP-binding protein [Microbacteriaceae bacterium]